MKWVKSIILLVFLYAVAFTIGMLSTANSWERVQKEFYISDYNWCWPVENDCIAVYAD